jgi:hypothetical protein
MGRLDQTPGTKITTARLEIMPPQRSPMASDGTGMHGEEKVYGSIP